MMKVLGYAPTNSQREFAEIGYPELECAGRRTAH